MTNLTELVQQGRLFAEQHVPPEVVSQALPVGILMVLAGVVVSVLGARLVRPVLTVAFAAAGVAVGWRYAHLVDLPMPVMVLAGGLLVGGMGFVLHRLWVGLVIALVASGLALSVFGYHRVLPELPTFREAEMRAAADDGTVDFLLLDPTEQQEYSQRSPRTWAKDFWAHLSARQSDIGGKMAAIGIGAALAGLLLGLVATRGALIVCTALVGTSLVMSGLSLAVSTAAPLLYASALEKPRLLCGGWAGLMLSSLVLQALLNRRPPARPAGELTR